MLTGALTSIGSSVLGFTSQAKQAKKQQAAQDDYMRQLTQQSWANFATQSNSLELQQDQQIEAQNMQNQQSAIKNLESKSTAEASALENGVSGNSIDSLLRGYDRSIAINDYISGKNIQMLGYQTDQSIKSLRVQAQNTINNGQNSLPAINTPSVGAALLQGLSSAVTGAAQGYEIGKTFKKTPAPTTTNKTGGTTI
jgi:hypothetical protein